MSEEQSTYSANPGKQLVRTVDGVDYQRIPVKTHLITNKDDYADVVVKYAKDKMQDGDILFCSSPRRRWPAPRTGPSPWRTSSPGSWPSPSAAM